MADERVPDARPRAVLRRHLLPARGSARAAGLPAGAVERSPRPIAIAAARSRGQGRQLAAHLREQLAVPAGGADPALASWTLRQPGWRASFDAAHGGFGGAPKFPAPMTLEFLLRAWRRSGDDGDAAHGHRSRSTAWPMAASTTSSGGGFARYSHRRALAGAALREDALRQRAAGPRLPGGVPGHRAASATQRSDARRSTS